MPIPDTHPQRTRQWTQRWTQQHLAGGLIALAGLAATLEARTFGMGTMARMGPGLYPTVLGGALTLVGVLIAVVPERGGDHDAAASGAAFGRPDWRGWSCIILGIAAFIVLGENFGLGPATFACVLVSAFGDRKATLRGSLVLAAGATLVAGVVFSWALKFQLPFVRW